MTLERGLTSDLWQSAWDELAKAGFATDCIEKLLIKEPRHEQDHRPQQEDAGKERFAPTTTSRTNRCILAEAVPLMPLGGHTWLAEVAEEPTGAVSSWTGDLRTAHITATDAISHLLETFYGLEHHIFVDWTQCPWPLAFTDAEQFYTLRDAINYVEQWLPGDCLQYPGLVGIVGLGVAVDECVIYSKDIPDTLYLGIAVSEWERLVRHEVQQLQGDSRWLDIAFSSLYGCICLQNLEKAMLGGSKDVVIASMDWKSLSGYFTRCEVALTAVTSFFVAAYSGVPYREKYVRPLSVAAASNGVMFDLAKRATGHGGGNVTEVDLGGEGCVEIRMRAHLTNRLLSFACDELPSSLTFALYRNWQSTSVMPLINDRYVERKTRTRAVVPETYIRKMDDILRATGGCLQLPRAYGVAESSLNGSSALTSHPKTCGWHKIPKFIPYGPCGNEPESTPSTQIDVHLPQEESETEDCSPLPWLPTEHEHFDERSIHRGLLPSHRLAVLKPDASAQIVIGTQQNKLDERDGKCGYTVDTSTICSPTLWLNALAADRRSGQPEHKGSDLKPSDIDNKAFQRFVSLSEAVPLISTQRAQILQSTFDGGGYMGRPVGGLLNGRKNTAH